MIITKGSNCISDKLFEDQSCYFISKLSWKLPETEQAFPRTRPSVLGLLHDNLSCTQTQESFLPSINMENNFTVLILELKITNTWQQLKQK